MIKIVQELNFFVQKILNRMKRILLIILNPRRLDVIKENPCYKEGCGQ